MSKQVDGQDDLILSGSFSGVCDGQWTEVRCACPSEGSPPCPKIPWSEIARATSAWQVSHCLDQFFFIRKPPGLRLRFKTYSHIKDFDARLSQWLSDMTDNGAILTHVASIYEPEEHRFGGQIGMDIAHRNWTSDSAIVIKYECLNWSNRGSVPRVGLWVAFVNDLLQKTLDDKAEMWDVWCKLAKATSDLTSVDESVVEHYKSMARNLFELPKGFWALLTSSTRSILAGARESNNSTARALKKASATGMLTRGLRSWLCSNALFQANRWGLGLQINEWCAAIEAMTDSLDPDRDVV
jgi:thiopeptide-type bacteriocin biosynthesis protein